MSVKINDTVIEGVVGFLIAIPILLITFSWVLVMFLCLLLFLLTPLIAIGALIAWLI